MGSAMCQQGVRVFAVLTQGKRESKPTWTAFPSSNAPARLHRDMLTFHEYVRMQETLLMRPPAMGLGQINPMPITNARRSHLKRQPMQKPDPFQPTLTPVPEVVPQALISKKKL